MKILIATHNNHKLDEFRVLFGPGHDLLSFADLGIAPPDEPADTFIGNATAKVRAGAGRADLVVADDSGVVVDHLGGKPGVHSARFAGDHATSADNNRKLLTLLQGVPIDRRTARMTAAIVALTADGDVIAAESSVHGRIGHAPVGAGTFGYDPIFVVDDPDAATLNGLTLAQLTHEQKNTISHRGRAFAQLMLKLREHGLEI